MFLFTFQIDIPLLDTGIMNRVGTVGGFGQVFKARIPNEEVVVKVPLEADLRHYFHVELTLMTLIKHPNILSCKGFCRYVLRGGTDQMHCDAKNAVFPRNSLLKDVTSNKRAEI